MMLGCSACFSARDDGTPELPFDPRTGELRPEVWQRWLDWDPVRMVDRVRRRAALAAGRSGSTPARGTSGSSTWAPQAFRDGLARIGVPDDRVHFELFEATHTAHRLPLPDGAGLAGAPIGPMSGRAFR